ncbi:MAG: tetratricopeptide repeat protein, partial [Pirellulales bacterium]
RNKRALLILDNFEHLLAAASWLVALLDQTEQLCLVVTSQKRLNVRGEQVFALRGLTVTPFLEETSAFNAQHLIQHAATTGVALFLQMARMFHANFAPSDEDAVAIQQICRLVEGLPLGIELAAAWTQTLSCAEIAEELQKSFDFLAGGPIDLPERHRSLRAIFDYSWYLLEPTEQKILARLSCLRGSFTREAALQISGASLHQLASLMDRTLIKRDESQASGPYAPKIRYILLETVRQFAAEQLALRGEDYATQQRHADFFTLLLARHLPDLLGGKQREAVYEIQSHIENIRLAWQWCEANLPTDPSLIAYVARSLDALFHFWDTRSNFQEGEAAFARMAKVARLMQQDREQFVLVYAKLIARQGWFAFHRSDPNAQSLLLRSLESLQGMNEEKEQIFPLNYLGAISYHRGEHAAAKNYLTKSLALTQHLNDQLGESIALNILGQIAIQNGELAEAERLCEAAIALKRTVGDQRGLIFSLANLGRIALANANYPAALRYFEESQTVCVEMGDQRGQAFALRNLGDTFVQLDNPVAARQHYAASLEIYQRIGSLYEAQETQAKQDGLTP